MFVELGRGLIVEVAAEAHSGFLVKCLQLRPKSECVRSLRESLQSQCQSNPVSCSLLEFLHAGGNSWQHAQTTSLEVSVTVGYATTNGCYNERCYNEQFLSINSGCYNERMLQRTYVTTNDTTVKDATTNECYNERCYNEQFFFSQ